MGKMKRDIQGIALLTKWVFETYSDPDSPETLHIDNVDGDESVDGLDSCFDPYTGTIDDPDLGDLESLWDRDGFAHEADFVGGWIVESLEGRRREFDLFDPDAPSKARIARSHRLHRVHPLFWL